MASTHKHIRSGTASKRPTTAIAEGQIALATNITSPGLFFKDSTGATIVKIGPVHVGTTAPNATPAGSAGNSIGEVWLDTSLTPIGVKIYNGTAFVNATPIGSTTVEGLLELATDAETQTGSDVARAVTPASLQSKLSDSTSTTSNTTIASSTAVKAAFDLANLALPKTGGTVTGNLEIGTAGSLSFEGATADNFETTIAVVDPTADRTITLPNITGTVVTTGDTGTVTSTMLLDGTILNADVNVSAAIAGTKIAPDFGAQTIVTTGVISPALGTAALPSVAFTGDLNTGIFSPGADQVAISTNGSERLRIDSSGRLGIGTSSPGTNLDVNGTVRMRIAGGGTDRYVDIGSDGSGTTRFFNNYTGGGDFGFTFKIGASDRMVLDSSGRLGIGTTSPGSALHVVGTDIRFSNSSNLSFIGSISHDASSTGNNFYNCQDTGGHVFQLNGTEKARIDSSGRLLVGIIASPAHQLQVSTDSAGKPSTNTWTIVSDERIKEEIELADLDLCYQAVKNIPLKRFKWKDEVYTEEQVRDRRKLGWIAQDVEAVFPKAVGTYEFKYNQIFEETIISAVEEELDDEGNVTTPAQPERIEKGELISEDVIEDCRDLNSDQLYAAMYGAIQKLMIKVEALETEIASLKAIG